MIELTRGNLLDAGTEALVNTVNTVGIMGKGIALQFKRAFPANFRAYAAACKRDEVALGKVFVFDRGGLALPRWILNVPTKGHWRSRSRLEDIEAGLADLRRLVMDLEIRSLAIPPLGCGHGGLSWKAVRPRIERALGDLDARILLFEPGSAPKPDSMRVAGAKPRLTPFRAALLCMLDAYRQVGYSMSPLEAQKLAYLLQAAGEDLKLRFEAHLYGPYAHALTKALEDLEGHYLRGLGDQQAPRAVFELVPGAEQEASAKVESEAKGLAERLERVLSLVEGFETPYGLELLASLHWLAWHPSADAPSANDADAAAEALRRWNARKAKLYDRHHVTVAWDQLASQGWLPESVSTRA